MVDSSHDRWRLSLRRRMASLARWTLIPDLINGIHYARLVKQVDRWMAMTPQQLERFQLERLREMVSYAYSDVELYRRRWRAAGVGPADIKTLADLRKLPVITRDDLKHSDLESLRSCTLEPHQCWPIGTSGSTGNAVSLFVDTHKALLDCAVNIPWHMAGLPPITVDSVLWDLLLRRKIRHMAIVVDDPSAYTSLYGRIFWQMRHTIVDALRPAQDHIAALNRKRPLSLLIYPGVLREICLTAEAERLSLHQPKVIMVVGEVLDGALQSLIKRTFRGELVNVYGASEVGFIAATCPAHTGLHLLAWKVLVELLDEDGREVPAGQTGRVVVTDLFNRATPIIRYAGLGDYAVRAVDPCSCGRTLPLLARVDGRVADSIVLPSDRLLHAYHLIMAMGEIPWASKFQIRQEQRDRIRVLWVKDTMYTATETSFHDEGDIEALIRERFRRVLGQDMAIDFERVADIPRRPGKAKFPMVVSAVSHGPARELPCQGVSTI